MPTPRCVPPSRLASRRHFWILAVALVLLLAMPRDAMAVSQDTALGFVPRQAYSVGSSETVNLYNFNLVASVPLSPSYDLSTHLSYGLTAYYNGGLSWGSWEDANTVWWSGFSNANTNGWLGAGWRLDFGKVVNNTSHTFGTCSVGSTWMGEGGSTHIIRGVPGSYGETQDGTDFSVWNWGTAESNCPVPTRVATGPQPRLLRDVDPNTGQITNISDEASADNFTINYMQPSDFDPNAPASSYDYRRPAPAGQPPDFYKEQTRAIKSISDSMSRTITTSMTLLTLANRFVLQDISARVFPEVLGHWTLFYEERAIAAAPPGWPAQHPLNVRTLPFLVRVETPADGNGIRLTYTFDYDAYGELTEIRIPSGARTVYTWGNEFISPGSSLLPIRPKARVVTSKTVYPSPYDSPATSYVWQYAHSRIPDGNGLCFPTGGAGDPWRALVTDPEGNDTEYRFYTTGGQDPVWFSWHAPGLPGAVKHYKGRARRWLDGAQCLSQTDPNFPPTGTLLRAEYSRYRWNDPNNDDPIHLMGTETIYFDDRLDPASNSLDPNHTDLASENSRAYEEMDTPVASPHFDGWAWNAEVHDPNYWLMIPAIGMHEYEVEEKGNLIGPSVIQILGERSPCQLDRVFSDHRVLENGILKALALWRGSSCVRRYNPALDPVDPNTFNSQLLLHDTLLTPSYTSGHLTSLAWTGGDPNSTDPNNITAAGVSYSQSITYDHGLEITRKYTPLSWFTGNRAYSLSGHVISSASPAGIVTNYTYDAIGRLSSVAPPSPETPLQIIYSAGTQTFTDSSGSTNTHRFSRTAVAVRGALSDPTHVRTQSDYDGLGRLTRELRDFASGIQLERTTSYDSLGAPTVATEWHQVGAINPPHATISYFDGDPAYPPLGRRDPFSRPMKITDPSGDTEDFSYFGLNDRVTAHRINGDTLATATTTTYRDASGHVRAVDAPDPNGADALYDYDYAGRLTSVRLVPGFTPATFDDADPNTSNLRYDRFAFIPTAGFIQTRSFTWDPLGNLRTSVEPEKGTTIHHFYDSMGNLTLSKDNARRLTHFIRDAAARTTTVEIAAADTLTYQKREVLTYANTSGDATGHGQALSRLIKTEKRYTPGVVAAVKREFTYSGLNGRLSDEKDLYDYWTSAPTDPWLTTHFDYDNFGLPSRLTYPLPDGSLRAATKIAYTYEHGLLTRLDSNKATNDPNVFTSIITVAYSPSGNPATLSFSNGVVETVSVDAQSRTANLRVSRGSATFWDSGPYAYDGVGNIIGIGSQTYNYDKIGRLLSATATSMDSPPVLRGQVYSYDPYGSMTRRLTSSFSPPGSDQVFDVDPNTNRLTAINPNTPINLLFDYDADGAVTTDGVYDYILDDEEHLTNVRLKLSPDDLESYAYDDRGWRTQKVDGVEDRTTVYVRGADGLALSEYAFPTGTGLDPHWKKDYIYALGRHIAAIENVEPAEPAGVTSSASHAGTTPSVSLSWFPVAAADIYGYYVYRSASNPSGPYTRLTILPTTATSFFDQGGLVEGTPYYYKLTSLDMAANESRETAPRKITPGDATPPAAPTNFNGIANAVPVLTWQGADNAAGDLAGYRIYRGVVGGALTLLGGALPVGSTSYSDTTTQPNKTYVYEIRSLDTAGNESSPNPSVTLTTPSAGGGGGCGPQCLPKKTSLVLPRCRPSDPGGSFPPGPEMFCLRGEWIEDLADHTGVEGDYRIVFYHTDHLGTPRVLTDEMGAVISEHALYPFGEEVPGPWSLADSTNTHWFTGHERDLGVGGDYMISRSYSAQWGRFGSADRAPLGSLSSSDLPRYRYAGDDPIGHADPDGWAAVCRTRPVHGPVILANYDHPQFFFPDGRSFGFFIKEGSGFLGVGWRLGNGTGEVKADDPSFAGEFGPPIESYDEGLLQRAIDVVKPSFDGGLYEAGVLLTSDPYGNPRHCGTFHDAVEEKYAEFFRKCRMGQIPSMACPPGSRGPIAIDGGGVGGGGHGGYVGRQCVTNWVTGKDSDGNYVQTVVVTCL